MDNKKIQIIKDKVEKLINELTSDPFVVITCLQTICAETFSQYLEHKDWVNFCQRSIKSYASLWGELEVPAIDDSSGRKFDLKSECFCISAMDINTLEDAEDVYICEECQTKHPIFTKEPDKLTVIGNEPIKGITKLGFYWCKNELILYSIDGKQLA